MTDNTNNTKNHDNVHIPRHRKNTPNHIVVVYWRTRHFIVRYIIHFCVMTGVGIPSIAAWEMIIKPILEMQDYYPHV